MYKDLSEGDIDNITYRDVLPEISSEIIEVRSKRKSIKNAILREYNITSSKYDGNVAKKIEKFSNAELTRFLEPGEIERKSVLREIF